MKWISSTTPSQFETWLEVKESQLKLTFLLWIYKLKVLNNASSKFVKDHKFQSSQEDLNSFIQYIHQSHKAHDSWLNSSMMEDPTK